MGSSDEFCLRWNNHQTNLVSAFHHLRLDQDFVDVTLACDGRNLQAHKVVLSACSPFFRDILKSTPCKHPVVILRDISYIDLVALIEYMYQGEVRISHDGLPSFLRCAEVLKVKGLAEDSLLRQKSVSGGQLVKNPEISEIFSKENVANERKGNANEVKIEDEQEDEECSNLSRNLPMETALVDSFDEENMEEHSIGQPSISLQNFARLGSSLPIPHLDAASADVLISDNLENLELGLGTSRDPQSPHECPYCNRRICNLYALRRHIRDRHYSQNCVYPCDLCGRTYRTKNSLTTHRSVKHRPAPASSPNGNFHLLRYQSKDTFHPEQMRMMHNASFST